MRILASLLPPDCGTASLGSIDLIRDPVRGRQHLGYLPQDFGVHPGVSARQLLDYLGVLKGLTDRSLRRRRVAALLEQVNLERDADRPVSDYSGGMRQRFGVAQALLAEPRLLIVDEPTAGLDPAERNRLHQLLIDVATRFGGVDLDAHRRRRGRPRGILRSAVSTVTARRNRSPPRIVQLMGRDMTAVSATMPITVLDASAALRSNLSQ